ncbi:rhomboid family intramembrane serine protease [Bacillus sp. V59.32b]|uniref:rhomboid family intramembrane serine protease n=1 Tax=Bacillus sp. V59.32b TaxID=1758642 RepID=UPI000E3E62E6|nr:rhomboid family intramembrane serine protease [Bacillus sp. V59.32b]RFU64331.1 rhomboid family intramembrane serine protease [Bacillus sp. V59.32b]
MLFIRRESFREFLSAYPITSLIVFLNTIMMIVSIFLGDWMYRWGGINRSTIIGGEFYRLLTYAFIHGGMMHFLTNMIFTIITAPAIEKLLGPLKFITLFFFSILTAALVIILIPAGPYQFDVGESGFGYSLFGFYFYLVVFKKNFLDKESSNVILALIAIGWLTTLVIPGTSFAGHLGGFVAGWLFAFLVNKNLNRLKIINNRSYYR